VAPRTYTHRERQIRRTLRARGEPCALCGGEIDYTLPQYHPFAFEVDHREPVAHGGEHTLDNCQPSHRRCNRAKSDKLVAGAIAGVHGVTVNTAAPTVCAPGPCERCHGTHHPRAGVTFVTRRTW
jgi:HNH endonuclease